MALDVRGRVTRTDSSGATTVLDQADPYATVAAGFAGSDQGAAWLSQGATREVRRQGRHRDPRPRCPGLQGDTDRPRSAPAAAAWRSAPTRARSSAGRPGSGGFTPGRPGRRRGAQHRDVRRQRLHDRRHPPVRAVHRRRADPRRHHARHAVRRHHVERVRRLGRGHRRDRGRRGPRRPVALPGDRPVPALAGDRQDLQPAPGPGPAGLPVDLRAASWSGRTPPSAATTCSPPPCPEDSDDGRDDRPPRRRWWVVPAVVALALLVDRVRHRDRRRRRRADAGDPGRLRDLGRRPPGRRRRRRGRRHRRAGPDQLAAEGDRRAPRRRPAPAGPAARTTSPATSPSSPAARGRARRRRSWTSYGPALFGVDSSVLRLGEPDSRDRARHRHHQGHPGGRRRAGPRRLGRLRRARTTRVTGVRGRVFPGLTVSTTPTADRRAGPAAIAEQASSGTAQAPPSLVVLPTRRRRAGLAGHRGREVRRHHSPRPRRLLRRRHHRRHPQRPARSPPRAGSRCPGPPRPPATCTGCTWPDG